MPDRPTTADELRRAFVDFFVERGHTRGAVGERDPGRQVAAVHDRGHGPVQELLHRRGDAAVQAGDLVAEVRARGRQAQRPRRHRPHEPSLLVLRDARQLQLRRLLQGRGDPVGDGSSTATCCSSTRAGSGSRSTRTTTKPSASGATTSGFPADRIQRLGDDNWWSMGDTGPVRPVVGDLLGPRARATGPTAVRRPATTATSRSGTSCSCSSTSRPTARASRCRSRASTPAPASSATCCVVQGKTSIWDIDVFRPLIERGRARHGRALRRDRAHRRVVAHHRRARARDDLHDRRRRAARRTRSAATCCGASSAARCCTRTCSARATSCCPTMVDAAVDVMGAAYPEIVANRETVREGRRARGAGVPRHAAARRRHARRASSSAAT